MSNVVCGEVGGGGNFFKSVITPRFYNLAQLRLDNSSDSPNTINLVEDNRTDGKNIWFVGSVWWLIFVVH